MKEADKVCLGMAIQGITYFESFSCASWERAEQLIRYVYYR